MNTVNNNSNNSNNTEDKHWQVLVLLLKEIAIEKGITQAQIATRTGLRRTNVARVFGVRYCPSLELFLRIARAVGVNFYFEDQDSDTDLNLVFERAMEQLGRRPDRLPQN